jgi:hypothetical protein
MLMFMDAATAVFMGVSVIVVMVMILFAAGLMKMLMLVRMLMHMLVRMPILMPMAVIVRVGVRMLMTVIMRVLMGVRVRVHHSCARPRLVQQRRRNLLRRHPVNPGRPRFSTSTVLAH